MKVIVTTCTGEYGEDSSLEVSIQTKTYKGSVGFGEGEPEDMSLCRDLSDILYREFSS